MEDIFDGDADDVTAKLAYQLWEQRGRPIGSPEVDWFAAKKALASAQRGPKLELPMYAITMEPNEGSFHSGSSANQK